MKLVALAASLLVVAGAGAIALLSPDWTGPGLVSGADRLTGGGTGVERAAGNVVYGTHDQRLDVWRPAAATAQPKPVLIFFHGGAWATGSRQAYAFAGRALAKLGYVVILPDYRKRPVAIFPAFMEDAAQALDWARRNVSSYGGDADRIGLIGQSSGAHMALLLALDRRWTDEQGLPANIVKGVIGISGPYDFYPFTDEAARLTFSGADPRDTQPINFARADAPPMLLIASRADTRVKPRNSIALEERLASKGARVNLVLVDGLSHEQTMLALMPQLSWLGPIRAESTRFLDQTLRGP